MNKDQIKDESNENEELADLENVEIQPLSDEDLGGVAGGICSWSGCSNGTVKPNQA